MGRRPRTLEAGIYHLAAHASDRRQLFLCDDDREDFLDRLARTCERFELGLVSYVLMGTHYHALVRIPDARLSRALKLLHTEYSRSHNRRHGRTAHLFRAHPYTGEIATNEQFIAACRYLAHNPVEAGLVNAPLEWPWSSTRAHAGLEAPCVPLAESELEAVFGGSAVWRTRYRENVDTAKETPASTA